jgi:hypothetical protein
VTAATAPKQGAVLTRDYKGQKITVTVRGDREFEWKRRDLHLAVGGGQGHHRQPLLGECVLRARQEGRLGMSDVQFYQTKAGRQYYEVTMPELVRQLHRLNDLLALAVEIADKQGRRTEPDVRTRQD